MMVQHECSHKQPFLIVFTHIYIYIYIYITVYIYYCVCIYIYCEEISTISDRPNGSSPLGARANSAAVSFRKMQRPGQPVWESVAAKKNYHLGMRLPSGNLT